MHERSQPPYTLLPNYLPPPIPDGYDWSSLVSRDGDDLESHYRRTLETLGSQPGTLGVIFSKAQNRIQEPAMLTRLVKELIDSENWLTLSADVKGDAYESLLERNAQDVKTGAGQYFTPRPLIQAIVDAMRPESDTTICDPACGTGGFLLAAHDYIVANNPSMDQGQLAHLRDHALHGWEIVDSAARLGVMNLYLHGIGGDETNIIVDDSLRTHPGVNFDMVLTNPPFVGSPASRSSVERPDFWATTSNKQLNFLQHVRTLLTIHGRAAVVVPDNVLFEGGAGETVRRQLLNDCDVHTLLRLPTGIFYAQGVKANVLFFDRKPASEAPWTQDLWIYDLRTNKHFTLKANPLKRSDLDDFVSCFNPEDRLSRQETERLHRFEYDELVKRDKVNLDIFWLRDESIEDTSNLPPPGIIAEEILEDLRAALDQLEEIAADFASDPV
ncbi:Probable type I restriction enzyme BthVORF4518P M protein [Geodia barretti]|uniref:site-specific DNA-methyltransferase (adenine-specific) n=1 Tax=Geodia barretti TaxID=519541 RepID=A0AA35WRS6_GEOBA|nr:Probable type I restriction enzyme BthVORF4518P M protein [Geodia barretti]